MSRVQSVVIRPALGICCLAPRQTQTLSNILSVLVSLDTNVLIVHQDFFDSGLL